MSAIASEVVGANQAPMESSPGADSSFSFSSLRDQAMEVMDGAANTQASTPEQVAAGVLTDTPATSPDAVNVDNASAAKLASLADTDLVTVQVDGQDVQMPWSEARGGVMRQAKFTKEMTALRREQDAFNTERAGVTKLQSDREMLVGLLGNKDMLRNFITQKFPDLLAQQAAVAQAAAEVDPGDIATVGQIQEAQAANEARLQEIADNFQAQLEKRAAAVGQEIEDKQATLRLSSDIKTTIGGLFQAHPYLTKVIPNAEEVLRWTVSNMKPQTEAETIEAFKTVVGGWVENYQSTFTDSTKQAAITKQKLVTGNIQPPGGAGLQPVPTNYKKTNSLTGKSEIDWSVLRSAAESMMGNK